MQFKNIKNPVWANKEKTRIDCQVDVWAGDSFLTVDYTADKNDPEKHGKEIFKQAKKMDVGEYVENTEYVKQDRIAELKRLLRESDYAVLPDYDKDNKEIIAQRKNWRNELRGLK